MRDLLYPFLVTLTEILHDNVRNCPWRDSLGVRGRDAATRRLTVPSGKSKSSVTGKDIRKIPCRCACPKDAGSRPFVNITLDKCITEGGQHVLSVICRHHHRHIP